jgi:hypothetical protein
MFKKILVFPFKITGQVFKFGGKATKATLKGVGKAIKAEPTFSAFIGSAILTKAAFMATNFTVNKVEMVVDNINTARERMESLEFNEPLTSPYYSAGASSERKRAMAVADESEMGIRKQMLGHETSLYGL